MKNFLLQRSIRWIGGTARAAARFLGEAGRSTPAGSADTLEVRLPAAVLRVHPSDGDTLRAEAKLYTSRWPRGDGRPGAPRLEFERPGGAGALVLSVELPPGDPTGLWLDLDVAMPESLGLTARVQAGTVEVAGLRGPVDLGVTAGSIRLTGPRAAYGDVDLRSEVGAVGLRVAGRRIPGDGLVGGSLTWKGGPGAERIRAACRVGEVSATLANSSGAPWEKEPAVSASSRS